MSKMKTCTACGAEIASSAKTCPHCGAKNKKPFYKSAWLWAIVIIGLIVAISSIGSETSNTDSGNGNSGSKTSTEATTEDNVPTEYKSALIKAKVYSDTMYMSKAAIYDQLVSEYGEQFSEEAAQYAMDNLEADWNENALKKAKTYQNEMAMSPSAIYDQLVSDYGEKFTAEEAQYAIDNLE